MPARKYSTTDIEMICALRDRLTASEIAPTFGTTRNAIIGVWDRNRSMCAPIPSHEMSARMSRRQLDAHNERRFA